ncbi:putative type I inositol 1,4,5-trisphosphate 5-phosphatase [Caenorhabditis elegans]|uniref:Probable type I inositol 1,4,5-trisphosphate 5-phosphatase n=1 Tax=Caenorhabditis elegans TaxID=6239 RepID=I5P1_CAEEL|nr:putative type I inositol 1,4,5-trisphosphate 5-phosphatase [Caenorhabditis elegans]Q17848.2 RecName: Full=Probable type I inositol 1,4,5-trisphosphate 5-phosphatase; Short=5PTase [Caenorhabditis elegans]CCD63797.1 Probable type I inositol 1,4,5-trisphosphate 5-phosphatase [Caenorhabditis elegans]|eukprot:NP_509008.2 Probable type I inositol 1,4,5-trisphosphate 5-phosphatase [Caenorhabditis elegans]
MVQYLLITANVGSLFEPDARLHTSWIKTVADQVESVDPSFFVIHLQETGGKKFTECSQQVPIIINRLSTALPKFDLLRAYVDIDYEAIEYTALGALCFIKRSLWSNVSQFNFHTKKYEQLTSPKEVVTHGLENYPYVVKHKFPKDFWPSIKWGRKGYMQTRWKIENKVFDFVNAHLFHDESNLALIHENPQLYSQNRKRALDFVLAELSSKENGCTPLLFVFGDLNFRLDSRSFLNRLTERTAQHPVADQEQMGSLADGLQASAANLQVITHPSENLRRTVSAIEFRRESDSDDSQNSCVLRIEKKKFDYFNHKKLLDDWRSYRDDDKETENFQSMFEMHINFPPTYPWSEDPENSETLMKTRAPAWCDRVLMNKNAYSLVEEGEPQYRSFGMETCTGDHKPVMLTFNI